ncbi:MAG: hypothetical protein IJC48_03220 [Clostridia bacterium]|nr:hypothetical protein [Clostridia bacterium]MBQ4157753.1 hypothetical protein [Clostridia bacterium]
MPEDKYSVTESSLSVSAPYSDGISAGAKLFLPKSEAYPDGFPVEILSAEENEGAVRASYRPLEFTEAVESYQANDVKASPDPGGVVILAEGFTLSAPDYTAKSSLSAGKELKFDVECEIAKDMTVSGSISYAPNIPFP